MAKKPKVKKKIKSPLGAGVEIVAKIDKKKISAEVFEKYSITDNTFAFTPKDDWKDKIEAEIGDSKMANEFLPQVKIQRWNNEVNLSVRLVHDETAPIVSSDKDKIKWSGEKVEAEFYDIGITEEHPEGAYEFNIILKERPLTNKVQFTLNTKGVDFALQPRMDAGQVAEEKAKANGETSDYISWINQDFIKKYYNPDDRKEGYTETTSPNDFRSENVVGSYAVYASENKVNYVNGKEYKCGKLGHIYRPKIEDANGDWVWGKLDIADGLLTVEIPQEFLDKAVYPVRHAAGLTFGYTTMGASEWGLQTLEVKGTKFTSPITGGIISKITVGGNGRDGTTSGLGGAIYSDNSGVPNAYLVKDSGTINPDTTEGWDDINISYIFTASSVYWLTLWNKITPNAYGHQYDNGASNQSAYINSGTSWKTFPNPFPTTPNYQSRVYSIYATFSDTSDATLPTTQILVGGGASFVQSGASAKYDPLSGAGNINGVVWSTTENYVSQVISTPGTLSNLSLELTWISGAATPTYLANYTFAVMLNGSPSALTVTINGTGTNQIGSDTVNSVSVVAGDVVDIRCVATGSPESFSVQHSVKFVSTNVNESLVLGHSYTYAGTCYTPLDGGQNVSGSISEIDCKQIVPTYFTLKNLYVSIITAPTGTNSWTFTVRKNGASTDLTCVIAGTATTANDTAHSVEFSPGDTIDLMIVRFGTPSTTNASFGTTCTPLSANEFVLLGGSKSVMAKNAEPSELVPQYNYLLPASYSDVWSATETDRQQLTGAFTAKKLYVRLSATPGPLQKSYTFALMKNGVATPLTVTANDTNWTGEGDTTNTVEIADGDNLSIQQVPTGTPTAVFAFWSLVGVVPPTGGTNVNVDCLTLSLGQQIITIQNDYKVSVLAQALTLTQQTAIANINKSVDVNVQTLTFTQHTTTINYDYKVSVAVQALTLDQQTPAISISPFVSVDILALTLDQKAATNTFDYKATVDVLTLILLEEAITIDTTSGIDVGLSVIGMSLALLDPTVSYDYGINIDALTLALNQQAITISSDVNVSVLVSALTLNLSQWDLTSSLDANINADVLELTLISPDPNINITSAVGIGDTYLVVSTDGLGSDTLKKYVNGVLVETDTDTVKTIYNNVILTGGYSLIITTINSGDDTNFILDQVLSSTKYFVFMNNAFYMTDDNNFPFSITGLTLTFNNPLPPDLSNINIKVICV